MSQGATSASPWASGDAYERYVGRWSRLVAPRFLEWLAPAPGLRWGDVGAGTGALSAAILAHCAPSQVAGVDLAEGFVKLARQQVTDPRATFEVGDATRLPWGDAAHDMAVSGLVLNFVPDPATMVREMARVTQPGGRVAAYVWDYADGMQLVRRFWDAAVECDPAARPLDEAVRFPDCWPGPLAELFAALEDVVVEEVVVPTVFADFDDCWGPFLGGAGPAPAYVTSLGEDERTVLRETLRARVPVADDGSIPLTARAWAVRGRRG
jgi:SAM-dependent methyltransferase